MYMFHGHVYGHGYADVLADMWKHVFTHVSAHIYQAASGTGPPDQLSVTQICTATKERATGDSA